MDSIDDYTDSGKRMTNKYQAFAVITLIIKIERRNVS